MISSMTNIQASIEALRKHPHILDKKHISRTHRYLGNVVSGSFYFSQSKHSIRLGDDAAAILQHDGSYLLLAAEGIVSYFLEKDPWFAGYSAVMVNISDICAMGGLPVAVTDTIYAKDEADSTQVWEGMLAASEAYGVPIVGGHTCYHSENKALSVSILGKATDKIVTSFDAHPGDDLLLAIDHNGTYFKEYSFWNASTAATPERLRRITKLPYEIANKNLSIAAKDVSMGGIIGTLCMLLNSSKVGAEMDLDAITKPEEVVWEKWLSSFPSYGYIFACDKVHSSKIQQLFSKADITCDRIGKVTAEENELWINYQNDRIKF